MNTQLEQSRSTSSVRPASVARATQSATEAAYSKGQRTTKRERFTPAMKGSILFVAGVVVVTGLLLALVTQLRGRSTLSHRAPLDIQSLR